jgi:hypothetical protein
MLITSRALNKDEGNFFPSGFFPSSIHFLVHTIIITMHKTEDIPTKTYQTTQG